MSIIYNGTTLKEVIYNGVNLDKVIYNGVVVFEKWVTKTGYYNKMTSATSPSSFSIKTDLGTESDKTLYFLDAWKLFDDTWTSRATVNCSVGRTRIIEQDLGGANIIPTKVKVEKTYTSSNATSGTITIYVSADGSSWTTFGSTSVSRAYNASQTFVTITNTSLTEPIRYIRMEYKNNGSHTQWGFNDCAIVEWKQQGA